MVKKISEYFQSLKWLIFVLTLLFILFPVFWVRIGVVWLIILLFVNRSIRIDKKYSFLFQLIVFSFGFIFSPYWNALDSVFHKVVLLSLLFIFGLWWSYFSSEEIQLEKVNIKKRYLIILGLLIYLVNYLPLKTDIAWRGDEDFHINLILELTAHLKKMFEFYATHISMDSSKIGILIVVVVILLLFVYKTIRLNKRKFKLSKFLPFVYILIPTTALLLYPPSDISSSHIDILSIRNVLRYPYIEKWLNILFTFPDSYGDIGLYRVIPFLSTILISWFLFCKLKNKIQNDLLALIFSFATATVPLIYFYSSILYLEMPIIFLMIVCIFDLNFLISSDPKRLIRRYSWYLLLLLSFLKEAALIFLLVIVIVRLIYQYKKYYSSSHKFIILLSEIRVGVMILSPIIIYLTFRSLFSDVRPYGGQVKNIFEINYYRVIIQSILDQIGFLFILSVLGFLLLIYRKKYLFAAVISALIICYLWFFLADGSDYIGYSRWNLYLLPMILYTSVFLITSLKNKYILVLSIILLFSNLYLSPIKIDGVRLGNWGSPKIDMAEYTYPYNKAMNVISIDKKTQKVLLLGQYYPYNGLNYYQNKYNINLDILEYPFHQESVNYSFGNARFDKQTEVDLLKHFFTDFKERRLPGSNIYEVDTILYHSVNNINLNNKDTYGGKFVITDRVSNSLNSLYILKNTSN